MDPIFIHKSDKSGGGFAQITNQLFEDKRISLRLKGLLGYLLSKPCDWKASVPDIVKHMNDGETAVRSAIKEGVRTGYMRRHRIVGKAGRIAEWQLHVYEIPDELTPSPDGGSADTETGSVPPDVGSPHLVEPQVGLPHVAAPEMATAYVARPKLEVLSVCRFRHPGLSATRYEKSRRLSCPWRKMHRLARNWRRMLAPRQSVAPQQRPPPFAALGSPVGKSCIANITGSGQPLNIAVHA